MATPKTVQTATADLARARLLQALEDNPPMDGDEIAVNVFTSSRSNLGTRITVTIDLIAPGQQVTK